MRWPGLGAWGCKANLNPHPAYAIVAPARKRPGAGPDLGSKSREVAGRITAGAPSGSNERARDQRRQASRARGQNRGCRRHRGKALFFQAHVDAPGPSVFQRARLIPISEAVALSLEAFHVIWRKILVPG